MTDHPMLFSGPMVRALLAGTKTQTRRALSPQPNMLNGGLPLNDGRGSYSTESGWKRYRVRQGDRIWVREAWRTLGDGPLSECTGPDDLTFLATDEEALAAQCKYRPGIHLFRWGSRITLHVTDVRVHRLCHIGDDDIRAEGVEDTETSWLNAWHRLWASVNGEASWEADPWVAAYTFTVEIANIDHARAK